VTGEHDLEGCKVAGIMLTGRDLHEAGGITLQGKHDIQQVGGDGAGTLCHGMSMSSPAGRCPSTTS
jgi:hypothetical protein